MNSNEYNEHADKTQPQHTLLVTQFISTKEATTTGTGWSVQLFQRCVCFEEPS